MRVLRVSFSTTYGYKMNIENIWQTEKKIKIATGMSISEAEELVKDFENEIQVEKCNSGGRPPKLSSKDIFLMFMLFYRHYVTYDLLGLLFEIDTSTAKRVVSEAEVAIRSCLAKKNFSHLIAPDQVKKLRPPLSSIGKSISMALNNLSGGPVSR
jgi:hypothetical protein